MTRTSHNPLRLVPAHIHIHCALSLVFPKWGTGNPWGRSICAEAKPFCPLLSQHDPQCSEGTNDLLSCSSVRFSAVPSACTLQYIMATSHGLPSHFLSLSSSGSCPKTSITTRSIL